MKCLRLMGRCLRLPSVNGHIFGGPKMCLLRLLRVPRGEENTTKRLYISLILIFCNSWKTENSRSRARTLRNPSFEGIPEFNKTFVCMHIITFSSEMGLCQYDLTHFGGKKVLILVLLRAPLERGISRNIIYIYILLHFCNSSKT